MSKNPLVKIALFFRRDIQYVLLLTVFYLSACNTIDVIEDPDAGRIVQPGSLSEVGPLLTVDATLNSTEDELVTVAGIKSNSESELQTPLELVPKTTETKTMQVSGLNPPPRDELKESANHKVKARTHTHNINEPESTDKALNPVNGTVRSSLHGRVALVGVDNATPILSGMILTLTPSDGRVLPAGTSNMRHVIDMEDKTYLPAYMTLEKGDQVSFVNKDKIKHNVFSSSGENAFDLGTYSAGLKRSVTFKSEGIVKIYCNIHSEMATFVAVDDNSLSVVADASGDYRFESVPVGSYQLRVWHLRGEMKYPVDLVAWEDKQVNLSFDVSQFSNFKHKNKLGKEYDKNAALFDDEFY